MCDNGVNVSQLKLALEQSDDSMATVQKSLEQLHHLADHGKKAEVAAAIAQAGVLLGEARGKLDLAVEELTSASSSKSTVELVS